jgi:phosphoenolpyruvate-protein kinase (PTS system EI component)
MTHDHLYRGQPVSHGVASGPIFLGSPQRGTRPVTADELAQAFAAVAAQRSALAERLREQGRDEQADIVAVGALIAADPTLVNPAVAAVRSGGEAVAAVRRSADAQASALARLDHPDLAARADDVRQVATAVLAYLAGGDTAPPPAGSFILVQQDVDPADLIRYAEAGLTGAVSVSGGANSHAAIIARGLGLPMVAGADPAVLTVPAGLPAVLDGTAGRLIIDPSVAELAAIARPGRPRRLCLPFAARGE